MVPTLYHFSDFSLATKQGPAHVIWVCSWSFFKAVSHFNCWIPPAMRLELQSLQSTPGTPSTHIFSMLGAFPTFFFFFYFFNYSHTSIAAQKSPPTPGLPLTPSELMASSSTPALHIGWTSICHLYLFFLLHRFTSTGRGRGEGTEGREGSGYKGSWSKVIFLFTFASFIICSSVYYRLHSLNKKH